MTIALYEGDMIHASNSLLLRRQQIRTRDFSPGIVATNGTTLITMGGIYLFGGDMDLILLGTGALAAINASWVGSRIAKSSAKSYQKRLAKRFGSKSLLEDYLTEGHVVRRLTTNNEIVDYTENILGQNSNELALNNIKELEPAKTGKKLTARNPPKSQKLLVSSTPVKKSERGVCYKHKTWENCVQKCNISPEQITNFLSPADELTADYHLNSYLVAKDKQLFLEEVAEPSAKKLWLQAYDTAISFHNVQMCERDDLRKEEKQEVPLTLLEYGARELQEGANKALDVISAFFKNRS